MILGDRAYRARRQEALLQSGSTLNGIIGINLERVGGTSEILVSFLKKIDSSALSADRFLIVRIDQILSPLGLSDSALEAAAKRADSVSVASFSIESPQDPTIVRLKLSDGFDPVDYYLIVNSPLFDPVLKIMPFRFRPECDDEFDCQITDPAQTVTGTLPNIDYLARDYQSLRQVLLDRLSVTSPDWTDRNPADPGVTLVELLAYVGDYLSYRQDFVATEANFDYARLRSSLKKHARLLGYAVDDGANARVALQLTTEDNNPDGTVVDLDTLIFSTESLPAEYVGKPIEDLLPLTRQGFEFFEPIREREEPDNSGAHSKTVYAQHMQIPVHAWSDEVETLPRGSNSAWVRVDGAPLQLEPGDFLILSPRPDPNNLSIDFAKRHLVRLVDVSDPIKDPVGGVEGDVPKPIDVQQLTWHIDDATPHDLAIGHSRGDDSSAVFLGNIILADHGLSGIVRERLPLTPDRRAQADIDADLSLQNNPLKETIRGRRYRPSLTQKTIAMRSAPVDLTLATSANEIFQGSQTRTLPDLKLIQKDPEQDNAEPIKWTAISSIIEADKDDRVFVADIESDGKVKIRFGDYGHGKPPPPNVYFEAHYGVGSGLEGNVGANVIRTVIARTAGQMPDGCWNPMPASGGRRPETAEQIRVNAPGSIQTQRRAITAADYAARTMDHVSVQRASARIVQTNSGEFVYIAVDRFGGGALEDQDISTLTAWIEPYRMMGHRISLQSPKFVPLELDLDVCVTSSLTKDRVIEGLKRRFSDQELGENEVGFFHPDRMTFGASIFASDVIAEAKREPNVVDVSITNIRRQRHARPEAFQTGELSFASDEIPILENSRRRPDNGILRIQVKEAR